VPRALKFGKLVYFGVLEVGEWVIFPKTMLEVVILSFFVQKTQKGQNKISRISPAPVT